MVDESKNGGSSSGAATATTAATAPNLETYLAKNGPMPWRECLAEMHDVCVELENETDHSKIGELTIRSFVVKQNASGSGSPGDTGSGISIVRASSPVPTDEKAIASAGSFSFPDEAYMSPERCLNKDIDRRADIYSLGCIMYQLLTGAPPFTHRDKDKLKEAQTIDYALPPGRRSQRRYIPDEVDALVARCLEKDPTKRFKGPGELRATIGKTLQLDEDADEEVMKSSKFSELFERKRKVFILVAGLVVLTGFLGYLSLSTTSDDQFLRLIQRSEERHRNKWFLNLEHGPMYIAQADFGNGKMEPAAGDDPIILKCKDEDIMLFSTTQKPTVKEAVEEAIKRRLILFKVNLDGADLKGATIPGGNLPNAFAIKANLEGANMDGCMVKEAIFYDCNLKDASMKSLNGERAIFQGANLENANLSGGVLIDCDFKDANLKNANLENSYLLNARFEGADVSGLKLAGATLTETAAKEAKLSPDQMKGIKLVEGPKDDRRGVRRTTSAPLGAPVPEQPGQGEVNPFNRPMDGSNAYGNMEDAPIGLDIPLGKPGEDIPIKPLPRKNPNALPAPNQNPTPTPHSMFKTPPPPKPGEPNRPLPAY